MDCEQVQDRLSDHVEGALPPAELEAVEQHLAGCPGCSAASAGLSRLLDELASLPPLDAPPELLGRVMAEVAGSSSAPSVRGEPGARDRSPWMAPLQVAATLLLVALGYGIGTGIFRGGAWFSRPAPTAVASLPSPTAGGESSTAILEGGRKDNPSPLVKGTAARGADAGRSAALAPAPSPVPRRLPQEIPAVTMVSAGGSGPPLARNIAPSSPFVPHASFRQGVPSREMILLVPAAARREAAERVALAARRCGALPPGHPPVPAAATAPADDGTETVRFTLPRPEAARFVSELQSIGSLTAAFAMPPYAMEEGDDVSFTIRMVGR